MVTDADLIASEGILGQWLIQTRDAQNAKLDAILAAHSGIGSLANDGSATLNLKALNIINDAGPAIKAWSIGGDGAGVDAKGHHGIRAEGTVATGSGIHARGFDPGVGGDRLTGGDGFSTQGFGWGAGIAAHGGKNCPTGQVSGPGIYAVCDVGIGAGMQLKGSETLPGLLSDGGANAQGALFRGGSAGGAGILSQGTGTGFAGMNLQGTGTAPGLRATIAF